MANIQVQKSKLQGNLTVPASKSHTLRAILFAGLARGISQIHNPLASTDADAMISAIENMGAKVKRFINHLEIEGTAGEIGPFEDVIQAGNSGIVLRFLTALSAVSHHTMLITGDASIRHQRPIDNLSQALISLGASVESIRNDGFAPLIVKGPMVKTHALLDGVDSQPVSALLIAAAFKKNPTEIVVNNAGELPWIDLTLEWFEKFKIPYENDHYRNYKIQGNFSLDAFEYTVPSDFSTAAFPIVAAMITDSNLVLENMDMSDAQGDKELIYALKRMGANIDIDEQKKTLTVIPGHQLKGIEVNINRFIDAVTILAVAACNAEGKTKITGAAVARNKESNRLKCITEELKKMGASIEETSDGLLISKSSLHGATVYSHHDHRMCMSLACAALGAKGTTTVQSIECIQKTYPGFVKDFKKLGASIEEVC